MGDIKLEGETRNLESDNVRVLQEAFPEVVADGKVDFDTLKLILGEDIDESDERYSFTWPGKRDAIKMAISRSTGTLRPDKKNSKDWDTTENLFIEGDNLEVLRVLQNSYRGKVKMIYIDPPYNTGKDFVYKDDFKDNLRNYKENASLEGQSNPETSGRYHTNWLNMMYPRLRLAKNLLKDDGVIFISIDDHEVHNLRKICDEIFGESNFVAQFVWSAGRKNDSKLVSVSHEYVLCYLKSSVYHKEHDITWRQRKKGIDDIQSAYENLKKTYGDDYSSMTQELKSWFAGLRNTDPAKAHRHYSNVDKRGVYFTADISWPGGGGPKYEVLHPTTSKPVKVPARGWMFSDPNKMKEAVDEDRVHFGDDENTVPTIKAYLSDKESQVPYSVFYQDGRAATKRLRSLVGGDYFDHPKDELVLKDMVEFATNKDSLVLDFFAGSATTAHAVMELNAEDSGNRRFIMVQIPEATPDDSEARKAGYATIAEISKERIRRTGEKIKADHKDKLAERETVLDVGFKAFTLDTTNFREWDSNTDNIQDELLAALETFKDGRTSEDALYEVLLKYGVDITEPVEVITLAGKQVYSLAGNYLLVCLEKDIPLATIEAMAALKPERVVCYDDGFADEDVKQNALETLKRAGVADVRVV